MKKDIVKGVRTDIERFEKWNQLASQLGMNRNQVFNLLIDNAEIVEQPQIKVLVPHSAELCD